MRIHQPIVLVSLLALAGCAATAPEVESMTHKQEQGAPAPLHQPKVEDLVEVNGHVVSSSKDKVSSTQIATHNNSTPDKNIASRGSDDTMTEMAALEAQRQAISDAIFNTYIDVGSDTVSTYTLMKGETYKAALYRWLHQSGYTKVGELLNEEDSAMLNTVVDKDLLLTMKLREALTKVHRIMVLGTGEDEPLITDFKISTDKSVNEAILSSTVLPTTMFIVKKGDLKTNYIRLATHYRWRAGEDMFMSPNYRIPFTYPIVTEKENVKDALQKLLVKFESVNAAVVPSSREIYLVEAKK